MKLSSIINLYAAISAEENLLRKWHEHELVYWDDNLTLKTDDLIDLGITPIQKQKLYDYSSFLGAGRFNKSYEGLYNGNHVAIKITTKPQEITAIQEIKQLSKDKSISKNLPKIYDVKEISKRNTTIYIAIVEFLKPLGYELKLEFDELSENKSELVFNKMKKLLSDKKELENILLVDMPDDIFDKINQDYDNIKSKLASMTEYSVVQSLIWIIKKHIKLSQTQEDNIKSYIYPFLPENFTIDKKHEKLSPISPKVNEFINTLTILNDKYGIRYNDLHTGNIMIRPSTGDLVISDFGSFYF
jgi:serine/threonine protein kinase